MIETARTEPLLWTSDLGTLKAFYERLGFEARNVWEPEGVLRWCLLEFRGAFLMLQQDTKALEGKDVPEPKRDYGLYFVCDGDIDAFYKTLMSRGVSATKPRTEFFGMRQTFVRDPDGRNVCFEAPVEVDSST